MDLFLLVPGGDRSRHKRQLRENMSSLRADETHSASRKRRAAPVREVDDFISAVPSKAARVLAEDIEEAAERRRTCSEASVRARTF